MTPNIILSLLLGMIFMHVLDDFVLQPVCLSKLKQKETWENHCKEKEIDFEKYKDDHIMALLLHSMSWSIAIVIPWLIIASVVLGVWIFVTVIINSYIHFYVDDLKANKGKISLVTDQTIHLAQIFITWLFLAF